MTIRESVRSFLTLRYPNLEVVIANDGSTDATLEVLRRDFDLVPVNPIFRRCSTPPGCAACTARGRTRR